MACQIFSVVFLCLLGLSVSLVYGQFPATRVAPFGDAGDFTDRVVSFDEFGSSSSGGNIEGYFCHITAVGNSWFDPAGTNLFPAREGDNPGNQAILVNGVTTVNGMAMDGIFLLRGADYYTDDGEWCCGANDRAQAGMDRCLIFTACPTLPEFMDGTTTYDGSTNTLSYACDTGFVLDGNNGDATRTCSGTDSTPGNWTGSDPTCIPGGCMDLTRPANGDITYNGGTMNSRPSGTVATYICSSGFTLSGASTRTCQSDGTFDGSEPQCMADNGAPALSGVVKITLTIAVIVAAVML